LKGGQYATAESRVPVTKKESSLTYLKAFRHTISGGLTSVLTAVDTE